MDAPVAALARMASSIPPPDALRGGTMYEPKWDGFRALVDRRRPDEVTIWSRQGRKLDSSFPELTHAALEEIPDGFVVDGEVVVWADGRLDFAALQRRQRAGTAQTGKLARQEPSSFAAFDVLDVAGHDVRSRPWSVRRSLLEDLAADWAPPLQLSPVTADCEEAAGWFAIYPSVGVEGLVCKGAGDAYRGGERVWVKVKHRDSVDVICGAVSGTVEHPGTLAVGLPDADGVLRIAGWSTPLTRQQERQLADVLAGAAATHPWPAEVHVGGFGRQGLRRVTLVEPIVVEVSADTAFDGRSFRHPVRFVRVRPDLVPDDVVATASARRPEGGAPR